ncbi:ATPase components of ABC transporters with duplicated ATPase domains [Paenibacillus sp. UNC496MF]|uniref:ABC-F family ATP-binding cassette domain-containing protein n=1 Tax=Paenibacillus sp. UNC496MF TaxID=1502753 RepID=UPI0008DF9BFA|nr:ABC-F family ATP-binding cassette domain-containing protein [Paenibacillus sp. UNC496MF]SFJ13668.1 ATPase components of ABC transporters with duplicated ATPase domains [Paenibacillus sp. UNC496MF]
MMIVNIQDLKKYHAAQLVLDGATLQLLEGEKVGLIGRNGSGKSTLLRLIAGYEQPDEGLLTVRKELTIGYLPQIPAEFEAMRVYDVLAYGYRELLGVKAEMAALEARMSDPAAAADPAAMERLLRAYASAQERFEQGGGYEMETAIDQVAEGLRLDRGLDGRRFGSLSGGEQTRVVLASQLVVRPDLLLLDEPTNHLDLKGIEWLESFLRRYEGAFVVVSHDRYFLDAVGTKMIELEDGEASTYPTNYTGYVKEKEARLLLQFAQYQEQQKVIKKMKETIRQLEEWGRLGGNEKFFKRAASIRKALERMDVLKRPVLDPKTAEFALSIQDRSGRRVLDFEGVAKRFGERAVLDGASGSLLYGEKVVLLGDNGSGKTTMFRLLLGAAEPDGGRIEHGSRVDVGYLAQQDPPAEGKRTVLDYFRVEGAYEEGEARGVLARYLFYGGDVFKPVASLSGGEWSRLRLALLVRRTPNLLLLDEPTNHLDIASREALEEALEQYPGTVLAISHDRYFINRLAQRVWELKRGRIAAYLGNYEDYRAKRVESEEEPGESVNAGRAVTVRAEAQGAPARPANRKTDAAQGGGKRAERLEREIAALEAELAAADERLSGFDADGDAAGLAAGWREREALQARLDALLEAWMALEP